MRIYRYLPLVLGLSCASVLAQSVRLVPTSLSAVPRGATATNPYWQHLVIDLSRPPSAGNTITINLPVDMAVADVNGNGSVADDISVDGVPDSLTGYSRTTGSTARRIVLQSPTGGKRGPVHVQFPVTTAASPASATAMYGLISFTNGNETPIPAGTRAVNYVAAYDLALMSFTGLLQDGQADTVSSRQGYAYPDSAAALFAAALPQLVSDRAGTLSSSALALAGAAFGNGADGDDVTYRLWLSTRDSLTVVADTSASRASDIVTGQRVDLAEGSADSVALDISGLTAGTYYAYVTTTVTGTFPVARSRGVRVRHDPTVVTVGEFRSDNNDYVDSGLLLNFDTGVADSVANARSSVEIPFRVLDLDTTASVFLFYADTSGLDSAAVTTSGTSPALTITGLTGATELDTSATLREGVDSTFTWNVAPSDTAYVAAGDYWVYAVVTDGAKIHVGQSQHQYAIRHSPFLGLDERMSEVITTGGSYPQRYYTVTWSRDRGIDGDVDRDDSSSVALYYSDSDSFRVPGGAQHLTFAAGDTAGDTHRIATGLREDADRRTDNQYVWDLWTYRSPDASGVPAAGVPYYLYGIISGGGTDRIVRWNNATGQANSLVFQHPPHLRIRAPFEPVAVDGRRSFEVAWDAADVDDSAGLWVVLVPEATGLSLGDSTTYGDISALATPWWVANSTDGSLTGATALAEDSVSTYAVRPSRLTRASDGAASPLTDGIYFAYVILDPASSSPPASASLVRRAPGPVTLSGLAPAGAGGLVSPAIEAVPAQLTLESVPDTARLEIRPHSGGLEVDVVSLFLSIDTTLVTVVDQDTAAGLQPYAVDSSLPGLTLVDTARVGTDTTNAGRWLLDLVYFHQAGSAAFDGSVSLASIQLASRGREGSASLAIDHLGNRESAMYRSGLPVAELAPAPVARIDLRPRATVAGRLRLQGRTSHAVVATFMLRDRNSFTAISDSLFEAANDADTVTVGVQDTLDSEGRFTLTQVPSGHYHLAAHVDRYLDGQYPDLRVYAGAALTGVDPTYPDDATTPLEYLLGGDVTGYVDTTHASIPDNQVDQLDVDFVVSYFGQTITASHAGPFADIDGDSLVWVPDLNLVAANFGTDGVQPVYRPLAGSADRATPRLEVTTSERTGGVVVVSVEGTGLSQARASGLRLHYDPAVLALRGHEPGRAYRNRPAVHAARQEPGELLLGSALMGAQPGISGRAHLAQVEFISASGSAPGAQAELAIAVDGEFVDQWARRATADAAGALPEAPALLPNYPNPFNPRTNLRLALNRPAAIRMEVFDLAGQRVRTLSPGWLTAGHHTVPWDGRADDGHAVASGPYFVHLTVDGAVQVRKIMLLR